MFVKKTGTGYLIFKFDFETFLIGKSRIKFAKKKFELYNKVKLIVNLVS